MDKRFWLILGAIVAVMIGLFALTGDSPETGNTDFSGNPREIQEFDHIEGEVDNKVVLIEYGDFQCPACAAIFPLVEQAKQEFSQDLTFVFRHFPLTSIHPNAMAAHRAAEAAGNQGQFFAMHDLLYARQQQWSQVTNAPDTFRGYAQELELNMEQYDADVASQEVFDAISRGQDSGQQLGFTGTPSFLLNGEEIDTPRSYEELQQLIQDAIDSNENSAESEAES